MDQNYPPPASIVRRVLSGALDRTFKEIAPFVASDCTGKAVSAAWIRGLRDSFSEIYYGQAEHPRIVVFGGRPRQREERQAGLQSGISNWKRWEMLYDVTVAEIEWLNAPYQSGTSVPIIRRAIWEVESEIANSAMEVAEDFSKLRLGKAENRLFVAARTLQPDPQKWLRFFARASLGMDGPVFLALVPSYAGSAKDRSFWKSGTAADVLLYRCLPDGSSPEQQSMDADTSCQC
jgi:hypothetical protein